MNHPGIIATGLNKVFTDRKRGTVEAVKDVSFEAYHGQIYGLLNPNGAGKTTALRMLATILTPTDGTASIEGNDIIKDPDGARKSLGFLSGDTGLYARLTAREMVAYFGKLYSMPNDKLARRVEELKEQLGMADFFEGKCAKLSTGQKQKVNIARTVIHDPPVLILDESTSGLDVLAARNIVAFIRSARDDGKCVVLSTHDMGEAERLCDRVGIIHNGSLVVSGTVDELYSRFKADNLESVFLRAVGEEE